MKKKELIDIAKRLFSDRMFNETTELPDDTPFILEIRAKNGYSRTISLSHWRALYIALRTETDEPFY